MKHKILWMLLSFLLVAALVLASCAKEVVGEQEEEEEEEEEAKWEFMVITAGDLDNPWCAKLYKGWEAAVEMLGVDSMVGLGEWDYQKTIDVLDLAIASGVDGILLHTYMDTEGLTPSIKRAHELGIHFVLIGDRPEVFTEAEVPRVGLDIFAQGYTCGLNLAERLKAAGRVSDLNIVTFFGNISAPIEYNRRDGILSALEDKGISFTAESYEGGTDISVIVDKTKAYLIANPETDVILGTGSHTTSSSAMALQELGLEPDEIFWAGFDLDPEIEAGVRAGYGVVNVDEVFSYGFLGCLSLYMRLEHGLIVGNLPLATAMVDQYNVDEYTD